MIDFNKEEKKMIQKGTEDYKAAQELANDLMRVASYERWNNNTSYNLFLNPFYQFINEIKELNTFASKIATTIDDNYELNGFKIANLSSKQAWILACAAIENNIKWEL